MSSVLASLLNSNGTATSNQCTPTGVTLSVSTRYASGLDVLLRCERGD